MARRSSEDLRPITMRTVALLWIMVALKADLVQGVATQEVLSNGNNLTDVVEYVLLDDKHPCTRKCIKDATPMVCRYHFALEGYESLSKACFNCPFVEEDCFRTDCIPGDGDRRSMQVINRMMPGPSVEVCLGDEVIIDVENHLGSESTTIHWHGHHQRQSPYMDGVPFITQCPVQPGTTFRYQFKVHNAGTHFWHSHSGFQRAEGAFGPFIVRVPEDADPHANLYDYDLSAHVLSILDWDSQPGLEMFMAHHHGNGDNKPETVLINGLGRFKKLNSSHSNSSIYMPTARFTVEQGYRYRFRLINAGFLNCPIEMSIDNHTMTVISSDGSDFKGVEVTSLVSYAGERFDFVLKANQPKDVYWIRFSGLMDCDERFTKAYQLAVLEYKDATSKYPQGEPDYEHSKTPGKQLNALNKATEQTSPDFVSMPQLQSLDGWDESLKDEPDFQYYVSYDFYKINNPHYHKHPHYGFHNVSDKREQLLTPQLNHISMKLLPFPLLSQRDQIDQGTVCNETTVQGCEDDYCECTHIVNLPLNAIVEMILIDKGYAFDANHPFHLHGHSFRVVAMERMGATVNVSDVFNKDKRGEIKRNLENPPIKDTVTVPDGGYTIIRFQATNPGYWLFHCHIEFHVEVGMALVFRVGDNDQMPPVPQGFPRCGNYLPDVVLDDTEPCKSGGVFANIVQELLPNIYKSYCSGSQSIAIRNTYLIPFLILCLFRFIYN